MTLTESSLWSKSFGKIFVGVFSSRIQSENCAFRPIEQLNVQRRTSLSISTTSLDSDWNRLENFFNNDWNFLLSDPDRKTLIFDLSSDTIEPPYFGDDSNIIFYLFFRGKYNQAIIDWSNNSTVCIPVAAYNFFSYKCFLNPQFLYFCVLYRLYLWMELIVFGRSSFQ